jgi:hypothetical protein
VIDRHLDTDGEAIGHCPPVTDINDKNLVINLTKIQMHVLYIVLTRCILPMDKLNISPVSVDYIRFLIVTTKISESVSDNVRQMSDRF